MVLLSRCILSILLRSTSAQNFTELLLDMSAGLSNPWAIPFPCATFVLPRCASWLSPTTASPRPYLYLFSFRRYEICVLAAVALLFASRSISYSIGPASLAILTYTISPNRASRRSSSTVSFTTSFISIHFVCIPAVQSYLTISPGPIFLIVAPGTCRGSRPAPS